MQIVPLLYPQDAARVRDVFDAAADHVLLESEQAPDESTVRDFFADRPPSVPDHDVHHLALEGDEMVLGIVGYLYGYPTPTDCYIGLLLVRPDRRGQGLGRCAVDHIKGVAREAGATRLLVAVLEENPKARAFWGREGFVHLHTFPPSSDRHTRHRLGCAL